MTNGTKSDRANALTSARSKDTKHSEQHFEPTDNSTANSVSRQEYGRVERLLHHGEQNAISAQDLLLATGIHSKRELQKQIESERLCGKLILSSTKGQGGYFLPSLDSNQAQRELLAFKKTLWSRAMSTLKVLSPVNRQLRVIRGQISFGGSELHE